ncbi:hypothetical protein GGR50DRAFT_77837 [Xylaria sp. CBS 124048]|nr:hypothetical protein GGR50DRAFT_77837 [Xylaria sp. CBS 124048]
MVGRRRRAVSSSTVATIDQETVRFYKESSILKPVDPELHCDDWPCFLLLDATVYRRDGTIVNQLHVDLEGPFVVRGRLELEMDNSQYLVKRTMKRKAPWIQVEFSNTFSVGAKDDSSCIPVIWASGAAGWFELIPSKAYMPMFNTMIQAFVLHHSLLLQYEDALEELQMSKKKKKPTFADVDKELDELLFGYALRAGDGLTLRHAYERLHEHAFFLLSHFPKETRVYKYIATLYPDIVKELAAKIAAPKKYADLPPSALDCYDYSQPEESSSLEASDESKKHKVRPTNKTPKTVGTGELPDVIIADIPKKINEAHASRSAKMKRRFLAEIAREDDDVYMNDSPITDPAPDSAPTPAPAPPRRLRSQRAGRDEDRSPSDSNTAERASSSGKVLVEALEDVRRQMLELIGEGKQKKPLHEITIKSWRLKVFLECDIKNYRCLEEIFHYHARDLVRLLGPEWHDTEIYRWARENASKPPKLTEMSEEEIEQLSRRVKPSVKPPPQASRTVKLEDETPQSEPGAYAGKHVPRRGRSGGKAAGLRPSTGSNKRLRHEIGDTEDEMDIDEAGMSRKRPRKSRYITDDEEDEGSDNAAFDDDDDNSSNGSRFYSEISSSLTTQLVIRAEKLPSARAQGPNQTWTCGEAGCGYVIRAAHEERGQKLISVHYEEHEKEAQDVAQEVALDRVNLAVQEAKGHLPINHLLDKIRKLGGTSTRPNDIRLNGHPVPEPIKRSLPV